MATKKTAETAPVKKPKQKKAEVITEIITEVVANPKEWWKSKTLWVNAITLVGSVVLSLGITGLDAAMVAQITTVALAVANVVLRLVTKDPVVMTKPKE